MAGCSPPSARCDFCGRPFPPQAWNCRTCVACAVRGAPDQSKLPWDEYYRRLLAYLRETGRRSPLRSPANMPNGLRGAMDGAGAAPASNSGLRRATIEIPGVAPGEAVYHAGSTVSKTAPPGYRVPLSEELAARLDREMAELGEQPHGRAGVLRVTKQRIEQFDREHEKCTE